jgi:hypothetical protein
MRTKACALDRGGDCEADAKCRLAALPTLAHQIDSTCATVYNRRESFTVSASIHGLPALHSSDCCKGNYLLFSSKTSQKWTP